MPLPSSPSNVPERKPIPYPPSVVSLIPTPKAAEEQVPPWPEASYVLAPPPPPPEITTIKHKLKKLRPETFIPTAWAVKNYEV
jgi:hypothetical protein